MRNLNVIRCSKAMIGLLVLVGLGFSCREVTEFYTTDYRYSYARPIGLMMSQAFDSLHLSGKGLKIGVIDAGFGGFKSNAFTHSLKVVNYRDFIDGDTTGFFSEQESDHGTIVSKSIGGKNDQNQVHGLAFDAAYWLAKTDIHDKEPLEDEKRLIQAVDWLISQEVRLINISLGYTVFDDFEGYTSRDLDGKTTFSSRYLDSLLRVYPDLIVVVSAGNEGSRAWKYLTFPADVKDVITVGSTDFDGLKRYKSSGIGVSYVDYVKPEVATYPVPIGNSNTTPVITGLIACLLELKPMPRAVVKRLITENGSLSQQPTRELGFGVPDSRRIIQQMSRQR